MNGKAKSISSISAICLALQAALNLGFSFLVGQLGVDKKSDFYYVCISALAVIVNIIPALQKNTAMTWRATLFQG